MGLGLAAALSVAAPAEAADTVREGTMRLGVERLVNIGGRLDDPNTAFFMTLLPSISSSNINTIQYPRVAFDYFIIDGLSIGGSAGFSFHTAGDTVGFSLLPRVGYAFELSRTFEFWPRAGFGVFVVDSDAGGNSSGVLTLDGMFVWEMVPHALLEFGPFFEAAFADQWPIELGGTAGIAIEF